jgi:hypothetical protein
MQKRSGDNESPWNIPTFVALKVKVNGKIVPRRK